LGHPSPPQRSGMILPIPEKCKGCGICELTCSLLHEGICSPQLSRIHLYRDNFTEECTHSLCIQCDWPACFFACPVGAIFIDSKTGARVIDESQCIGCGSCAKACPLNSDGTIIKYKSDKGVYFKCDLCQGREKGPACVEACPWEALKFIPASERG
jgi:carbon-monoxide dehydrogenase iron sulfur subunit